MEYNPNFRTDKMQVKYQADIYKRDEILSRQAHDKVRFDVPFNLTGDMGIERYRENTAQYAVKNQCHDTPLIRAYFSRANVQLIQNGIRAGVYAKIKRVISEQNERELHIIMRAILFQKGVFLDDRITDQINVLNNLVLGHVIMQLVEAVQMDDYYMENAFDNPEPIENQAGIRVSVRGRNTLELPVGL